MLLGGPCPDGYSLGGYTLTREYLVMRPNYAEVAAASPSAGPIEQLDADLNNLMHDCQEAGWDGYGAEAITTEAYFRARRFIESLPAGIPIPALSADPEGCVTFEWQVSPRRLLLVSVHPDYRIDYAALFGSAKSYGTEPFFDKFPAILGDLVRRVYPA